MIDILPSARFWAAAMAVRLASPRTFPTIGDVGVLVVLDAAPPQLKHCGYGQTGWWWFQKAG